MCLRLTAGNFTNFVRGFAKKSFGVDEIGAKGPQSKMAEAKGDIDLIREIGQRYFERPSPTYNRRRW